MNASARSGMPPDHVGVMIAAGLMIVVGWMGLFLLVTQTVPRPGQQWLFFVLLYLAVTGTMTPLVRFVNVRITPVDKPLPAGGVIARQAMWVGLFAVTCAWLQIPRVLSWPTAFFLVVIFLVLEFFLRLRERDDDLLLDD